MFRVLSFFEFQTWDMVLFLTSSFLPGETKAANIQIPSARVGDWWIKYIGCACMEWDIAPTVKTNP